MALGFDLESDGLIPEMTKVHSLVIKCDETGTIWNCHDHEPYEGQTGIHLSIDEGLRMLMEAPVIYGHNIIEFDVPAIQKIYPWWQPKGTIRDTIVLSRLIWVNMLDADFKMEKKRGVNKWITKYLFGRHSLESWGQRLGLWKGDYGKEKAAEAKEMGLTGDEATFYVWGTWSPEMQEYCVQDVEVTEAVWMKCLAKETDERAVMIEHVVRTIITRQENWGFAFDEQKAQELYAKLAGMKAELEAQLFEIFKPWYRDEGKVVPKIDRQVQQKHLKPIGYRKNKKTGLPLLDKEGNKRWIYPKAQYSHDAPYHKVKLEPFNPGSRHDIANRLKVLYGWKPTEFTDDGSPKVDETVLKSLKYPPAPLLTKYLLIQKRIGQICEGKEAWLRHVKNGRIHGRVSTNAAVTGRMTHSKPNVAQVPSGSAPFGPECRTLFTASKGRKLVGCDADALELRCLAGYMAAFDKGAYIKTVLEGNKDDGTDMHTLNAKALGCSRDVAKVWFYAFIYGAGDFKLGSILGTEGSKKAITAAGTKSRAKFLDALPALKKLVEAVKKKAIKLKKLKGLDGRVLPVRSQHAALNTLLQSAGAILMKMALVVLDRELQAAGLVPGKDYEFAANIHDEWQIDVSEDKAEQVAQIAADAIRMAGEELNFKCPTAGNADIGDNWAETH